MSNVKYIWSNAPWYNIRSKLEKDQYILKALKLKFLDLKYGYCHVDQYVGRNYLEMFFFDDKGDIANIVNRQSIF